MINKWYLLNYVKSDFRVSPWLISLLVEIFVAWISMAHTEKCSLGIRTPAQCFKPSCISVGDRLLTFLNISGGPLGFECLGPQVFFSAQCCNHIQTV